MDELPNGYMVIAEFLVILCREGQDQVERSIEERGNDQHRPRTVAVGRRADERLRQAPDDVLQRDGKAEGRGRDAEIDRHRPHEESEALPQSHAERDDGAGEDNEEQHGAAVGGHR